MWSGTAQVRGQPGLLPRFGNCIRSVRPYCPCLHSTLYSKVSHLDVLREPHFMRQLRQEPHINKTNYLFFFNGFFLMLIQIKQLIFIPLWVFCLQKVFQNAIQVSLVAVYTICILFACEKRKQYQWHTRATCGSQTALWYPRFTKGLAIVKYLCVL